MAAHQAPLSLGFSRQEHWSGLPFPSPMHESESEVAQSCLTQQPYGRQPTRLPCPWDSPGKKTGVGCHFLLQCIKVKVKSLSHVRLFTTLWAAAYQAPPSMGFSRQEYWIWCTKLPQFSYYWKVKPLQILYRIKGDNSSKTFNNRWMCKENSVKSYSGILTGI